MRTQFTVKLPVFKEKKCYLLYKNIVCWGCAVSQTVFGTNLTFMPTIRFARILSNMLKHFLNL